uniref:Uncharacterized protein n=1 Tax=Hippocampus comes TaxID=109280 RepID=A0A3Q2YV60_HIPCM
EQCKVARKWGATTRHLARRLARLPQTSHPGLGHVIAPLGLVKVQLLLGVGEHGQVGHGPLFAETGRHRQPALGATRPVNLEFAPLGTLRPPGFGPLGPEAKSFAICLAVRFGAIHLEISFPAFHTTSKQACCMRDQEMSISGQRRKMRFHVVTFFLAQRNPA